MTNTTQTTDACRNTFEKWASCEGEWNKAIERDRNGEYLLMQTHLQWGAWKRGWEAHKDAKAN